MSETGPAFSNQGEIQKGVPQGSILGLILFLIYINDLQKYSDFPITQYADDTSVVISDIDKNQVPKLTKLSLDKLSIWFKDNNLLLNTSKTNLINFNFLANQDLISLSLENTGIINSTNAVKFLGLSMSYNLKWDTHVTEISKKLTATLFQINSLKKIIHFDTLKMTYFGLFQSRTS